MRLLLLIVLAATSLGMCTAVDGHGYYGPDTPLPFDSGPLAPGARWEFIASTPGLYAFHCPMHGTMEGTIHVDPHTEDRESESVHIRTRAFLPAWVNIPPGAPVVFSNDDATAHDVRQGQAAPSPATPMKTAAGAGWIAPIGLLLVAAAFRRMRSP